MQKTIDCKHFNGYKPCRPGWLCWHCKKREPWGTKILIINLDALGAVLMTTALLPAIKRQYPKSVIHWATLPAAVPLLQNNPYIDKIWPYDFETASILQVMKYDRIYSIDKAHRSDALALLVRSKEKLGFALDENGAITYFNSEAEYAYRLGLDDKLKFKRNKVTGVRFLARAMKLDYRNEDYVLRLTDEEKQAAQDYRVKNGIGKTDIVIGFNTGCSDLFPNKKMTVEQHVRLIKQFHKKWPQVRIMLLGGKAETGRNAGIRKKSGAYVLNSPTAEGLRRGLVYLDACDLVITGDTSALHMAVALKKWVVAWFGLSCASEIELYGRGEKILSDLDCTPCWKKSCDTLYCIKRLDLNEILLAVKRGVEILSKRHLNKNTA
ncbi:glycosyltransferase family 9 protein [candidate division TA06 bacterium]|uniref:Glycosyltransferase family 9 protein n=1 Tax=candidate division TA06 bacterium TaxID=2250710 RepID=A0A933I9V1_UNCT6|nr:glycosyltransferase family 9 protein [candidate division TA06 bacterium]